MSRSADLLERLRREHAGTLTGSLIEELAAVLEQEATGDVSVVAINSVQRDEIDCLRAGLENIAGRTGGPGRALQVLARETLENADAIVREGGA